MRRQRPIFAFISTHLSLVFGSLILKIAFLLLEDSVARFVEEFVAAIGILFLLLPEEEERTRKKDF